MALKLRKALLTEGYLRGLARKSLDDKKLACFKRQIIAHLKAQKDIESDPDTMEKAVYGIGTIRTWKGRKYIKGADKKWRRYYDKENRGARISIKNLIKKVEAINSTEELMSLVMLHRDRFSDEYGHPIPIVQELSRYVRERGSQISQESASHGPAAPQVQDEKKKQKGVSDFIEELDAIGDTYFSKQAEAILNVKPNAFGGEKTIAQLIEEGTAIKAGGWSKNKKLFEKINSQYKEYLDGNFAGKKDKVGPSGKTERDIINSGKLDDWKAEYAKKNEIDTEGQKKLQEVIDIVRKQQYIMAYKSGNLYNFNNILPTELKGKFAIFLKNKIKKEVNSAGKKVTENQAVETDKKEEAASDKEPAYSGDLEADFDSGKVSPREIADYLKAKWQWDIDHPVRGPLGDIAAVPIKIYGTTGQGWEKIANWVDGIKNGTKDIMDFKGFLGSFTEMPKEIRDRLIKESEEEKNQNRSEAMRGNQNARKAIDMEKIKIVFFKKSMDKKNEKKMLEYFKRQILNTLGNRDELSEESPEKEGIKKAGYPVGTVRTWKGREVVKVAPGKWRPKYNSESRGAKMAVSAIKNKVNAARTAKELMDIVMENRERFSDLYGNPLPFVKELSDYISERHDYLPENIKARRKEERSKAIKEGQRKAKEKREEAKRAAEENIRQKAERMKNSKGNRIEQTDDSQENIDFLSIRDKYQKGKNIEGNEDEIYVGDETMKGRWKLVEADAPAANHDETTFNKTRGFPANKDGSTINDRDYQNDRAAQEMVMSMGTNFDGRALSFDSPVVVTQDGIVVSGNNRTMSSKIAARKGSDTKYIDALKKRAARFGFTGEDIKRFHHPRVIFEIEKEGGYSTGEFAKYNQESQKTMGPLEEAVKVSKIIKKDTVKEIAGYITEFETMGELYASKKTCMNIFNTMEKGGIINQFNRNSYIDPDGVITDAGKKFMETVLIGSVVNEQNIRGLNREGCKHIRAKLVRAITPLVNNKSMGGYSIMEELNQAIDLFMQFNIEKDKFGTLDDLVKQGTMFEAPSGVAVELARKMQMNQKDFAEFMQKVNVSLEVGASGQSDIFIGEVEGKDEILKRFLDIKKSIEEVIRKFQERKNKKRGGVIKKSSGEGGPETFDVALDFDGVINSYKNGWKGESETDEPVTGAAEGILRLLESGLDIVIYSTRAGSPEGEKTIRDYLRNLIGESAGTIKITDRKPIAAVYVDDRAVTFSGNWEEMPEKIEKFKSWVDKSLTWSGHKLQGRTRIQGMDISIENKKGSVRSGTDKDGHDWSIKMAYPYGYIRGTIGVDGDHLDCYLGPNPESEKVFIVNQNDPATGKFDEQKVMLGFDSLEKAKEAYLRQYDRLGFLGDIETMEIEEFKEKAFSEENKWGKIA
jgi:hypothetical protein